VLHFLFLGGKGGGKKGADVFAIVRSRNWGREGGKKKGQAHLEHRHKGKRSFCPSPGQREKRGIQVRCVPITIVTMLEKGKKGEK